MYLIRSLLGNRHHLASSAGVSAAGVNELDAIPADLEGA